MISRKVYLSNIDLEEAKGIINSRVDLNLRDERVLVHRALGRMTSEPIYARISSPHYNASAMDGIAVVSSATKGADVNNPVRLELGRDFTYVDTGDPIVEPYNSVIMIEDIQEISKDVVEIISSAPPWSHIRPVGEDIVQGEMIVSSNHSITGVDIGAMLAGGLEWVNVISQQRVGIIPTGTEIIEPGDAISIGKIIDSNSRMLEALVLESGGMPTRYSPVEDDYDRIKKAVEKALEDNDIVLINAGSSAGREDYTVHIIEELGEVLFHGIAIKPGKPTMAGIVDNKLIVGIPGYPVSAFTAFEALVKPLIMGGRTSGEDRVVAQLSKRVMSSMKHKEFMRIKLGNVGNKLIATPLNRGAGVTMSLVRADGVAIIPKRVEGMEASEDIEVRLLKDRDSIDNTLVSIGSHDMIMDTLSELIHRQENRSILASSHVGSMGGIMALKRGEAHVAPVHILEPQSGTYNIEAIKRYLGSREVVLIEGIRRSQGLMVARGNPKDIKGIPDLIREDVIFVNRQRGSGTRILLDYRLDKEGLDCGNIQGYDREMTTHMTVASAIVSGTANAGMGIKAAAVAMNLDFIPIDDECYDFIIPKEYIGEVRVQEFIRALKSEEFIEYIKELDGYSIESAGVIKYDSTI